MKENLIILAILAAAGFATAVPPPPTHPDVVYGSHPRNLLDLWLAPSDKPTPLLVNIHGGGFQGGDKRKFSASLIEMMHKEGISVASINYRFKENGRSRFEGEDPYVSGDSARWSTGASVSAIPCGEVQSGQNQVCAQPAVLPEGGC